MDILAQVSIYLDVQNLTMAIRLTLDSVPAAAVTAVVIALSLPNGFPYHGRPLKDRPNSQGIFSKKSIQRLDFPGTALLLITCIFLVAALEMGGVTYPWKSAFVSLLLTSLIHSTSNRAPG